MELDEDFVSRLYAALDESGITRAELARQLDIPAATIYRIFSGTCQPDMDTVRALAGEMDTDLLELVGLDNLLEERDLLSSQLAAEQAEVAKKKKQLARAKERLAEVTERLARGANARTKATMERRIEQLEKQLAGTVDELERRAAAELERRTEAFRADSRRQSDLHRKTLEKRLAAVKHETAQRVEHETVRRVEQELTGRLEKSLRKEIEQERAERQDIENAQWEEIKKLEAQLEASARKQAELEAVLESERTIANARHESDAARLSRLDEQLNSAKRDSFAHVVITAGLEDKLKSARADLEGVREEFKGVREERHEVGMFLSSVVRKEEQANEDLQAETARVRELEAELATANELLAGGVGGRETLDEEDGRALVAARAQLKTLKAELAAANERASKLERKCEELLDRATRADAARRSESKRVQDLKAELMVVGQARANLKRECEELRQRLEEQKRAKAAHVVSGPSSFQPAGGDITTAGVGHMAKGVVHLVAGGVMVATGRAKRRRKP